MSMQKLDQDRLAEKLNELGMRIKETKAITAALQQTVDRNVEVYTWIAGKLGAAQIHFTAAQSDIANGQSGPPEKGVKE